MVPDHFLELLHEPESEHLEFKSGLSSPYKAAREMAAMANTVGGNLVVGIDDNGLVVGVDDPEREIALLREAAELYCIPPLSPVIRTVTLDGKTLVDVQVARGTAPHKVRDPRGETRIYVRVRDKNLPASRKTARQLAEGPRKTLSPKGIDRHARNLLTYLSRHDRITVQQFARAANISRRRAVRIIVGLEQAGMIRSHDFEKRTFYSLNPEKG